MAPELDSIIGLIRKNMSEAKLSARFVGSGPTYEWTGLRTDILIADLNYLNWNKDLFICNVHNHPDFGKPCIKIVTMGIPLDEFHRELPLPRKLKS